jgi:hypothetical protein
LHASRRTSQFCASHVAGECCSVRSCVRAYD